MLSKKSSLIFQDFMPNNICFGCGKNTKNGLHIKSYWNNDVAQCDWTPKSIHQGWPKIMNGGIIATIMDCHCMGTAMAYAHKMENRELGTPPEYRYATGSIKVRYILPTPNKKVLLRAKILSYSEKKVILKCDLISNKKVTATGEVIAFRVFDSSKERGSPFKV